MTHLPNLLAAIALLVWGTHLVRKDTLRVLGANLRKILAQSVGNHVTAVVSGIGVTALLQSSTATALIISAFVGQGLMTLPAVLAAMQSAAPLPVTSALLAPMPPMSSADPSTTAVAAGHVPAAVPADRYRSAI